MEGECGPAAAYLSGLAGGELRLLRLSEDEPRLLASCSLGARLDPASLPARLSALIVIGQPTEEALALASRTLAPTVCVVGAAPTQEHIRQINLTSADRVCFELCDLSGLKGVHALRATSLKLGGCHSIAGSGVHTSGALAIRFPTFLPDAITFQECRQLFTYGSDGVDPRLLCQRIERCNLAGLYLHDLTLSCQEVGQALAGVEGELNFHDCHIYWSQETPRFTSAVRRLNFSGLCRVKSRALGVILAGCPSLKELSLPNLTLGASLVRIIERMSLEELDLTECHVRREFASNVRNLADHVILSERLATVSAGYSVTE
jgi:hypothetical protein